MCCVAQQKATSEGGETDVPAFQSYVLAKSGDDKSGDAVVAKCAEFEDSDSGDLWWS